MARTKTDMVRQAAKWLDERAPGWAFDVRTSILDMDHSERCVMGQVYGGYGQALMAAYDAGDRLPTAFLSTGRYLNSGEAGRYLGGGRYLGDVGEGSHYDGWRNAEDRARRLWTAEVRKRRGKSGCNSRYGLEARQANRVAALAARKARK